MAAAALVLHCCLLWQAGLAASEPIIVHAGKIRPLFELDEQKIQAALPPPAAAAQESFFPLRAAPLRPGTFAPTRHGQKIPQTMFVVGEDDRSRAWLRRHRQRLQRLGAIGLVVAARDAKALRSIREAAHPLPLYPSNPAWLAEDLGLRYYPALIDAETLRQ